MAWEDIVKNYASTSQGRGQDRAEIFIDNAARLIKQNIRSLYKQGDDREDDEVINDKHIDKVNDFLLEEIYSSLDNVNKKITSFKTGFEKR